MVAAGLADPDPEVERRRIVMPPPLAGDDPAVAADALALAAAIEAMVPANLPSKFCVALDGGGVLAGVPAADIVISLDGKASVAETLALVRRQLLAMAGQPRGPVQPARAPGSVIGFHRYATGSGAFGLGLPFGQTDPAGLRSLAGLADRFSEGAIRTSPWRVMLLGRVHAADVPALRRAAAEWVHDPDDPRLGITACVGSPGCERATVPARADAAWLAANGAGGPLHISGCAKGCAYSGGPALVGGAGCYSRVDDWRAGTTPAPQHLTLTEAA
jgi:precorrin-3B synthase